MTGSASPEGGVAGELARRWATVAPWLRRYGVWLGAAALVVAVAGILLLVRGARSGPEQPPVAVAAPPASPPSAPPEPRSAPPVPPTAKASSTSVAVPVVPPADAGARRSSTVKIAFRTFPPRRATVMWGGKRLGVIDRGNPLVVERPRDSGPIDVVIRAPGYLAVHARAYTFEDNTLEVRITPVDKKDTIYGYQEPIPEDAGAPPPQ